MNKRILKKYINQVKDAWRNCFNSAFNLVDRRIFAEEQERVEARDLFTQESMDHQDWLNDVEVGFINL